MSLYEDLGVPHDASAEEIKRAYRSKASTTHPDKGGDAEQFQVVAKAYETLSCPERRDRYDRTGDTDKPVDPVEMKLAQLFERIIEDQGFHKDLIGEAFAIIAANVDSARAMIHQATTKRTVLNDQVGRIKCAGDHNLFEGILLEKIKMLDKKLEGLQRERELMLKLGERLREYKDEWA